MAKEEGKVMGKDTIVLSQTDYKGNSHFDTEEIEIIADGSYYKVGQKDTVHPSVAAILRAKGLIAEKKEGK